MHSDSSASDAQLRATLADKEAQLAQANAQLAKGADDHAKQIEELHDRLAAAELGQQPLSVETDTAAQIDSLKQVHQAELERLNEERAMLT